MSADQAVLADPGMVEDRRFDAYQSALADGAPVQHDLMADGHVFFDGKAHASVGMQYAAVLDVRPFADRDEVVVPAHDGVEPDADIVLQHHLADDRRAVRDPIIA